MHDPNTLVAELRIGPLNIQIWHRDKAGPGFGDDNCGWTYPPLNDRERNLATDLAGRDEIDNLAHWFPWCRDQEEAARVIGRIFRIHKRLCRKWWQHPRWHVSHWRLSVRWWPRSKFKIEARTY